MNQAFESLLREILEERASISDDGMDSIVYVEDAIAGVRKALNDSESVIYQP